MMNFEKQMRELLRPVGFKSKKINSPFTMFNDKFEHDCWAIRLTYKGKQMDSVYVANKGDYKEPKLDLVLNSYFTNSHMYQLYDFFDFAERFGGGFNGASGVDEMYNNLAEGHNRLLQLFGDDFEKYSTIFKLLRPASLVFDLEKKITDRVRRRV